ncbi:hypothetical protein PYCC9005_004652 [Savitreella phatthalungensis]
MLEYRRLGKSGLRVSPFIVGCMSYGSSKWQDWVLDEKESIELIKAAFDAGINTFDSADTYSNGKSEEVLGKALKQHSIPREQVVILTKCFFGVADDGTSNIMGKPSAVVDEQFGAQYINRIGLSRKHIIEAVDASLKRLDTGYIDVLQIHRLDKNVEPEEIMEALHDVVKQGKVRYIGASSMYAWEFAQLQGIAERHGWTKFISMQNFHNLLYREEEREMLPLCKSTGVGIIPWSPLARGVLARPRSEKTGSTRAQSDPTFKAFHGNKAVEEADGAVVDAVEKVAKARGVPMAQIAIAWSRTRITAPILGISSIKRLQESLDALNIQLSEEEIKAIEAPYVTRDVFGLPPPQR